MKKLVRGLVGGILGVALLVLGRENASALETTGALDRGFNAGTFTDGQVSASLIQPDGKFLVSGQFAKANGVPRRNIARFHPDGALDTTFDPGSGADTAVGGLVLQPDGKIIIYNGFRTYNGVPRSAGLARVNANGALDASFTPGNALSFDGVDDGMGNAVSPGFVTSLILQADGKVLVFGQFYFVITGPGTSVPRSCVARFNSDGTFDPSFDPGTGFTSSAGPGIAYVASVVRQGIAPNEGKIVALGEFDAYRGNASANMVRFDANGAYDPSFVPPAPISVNDVGSLVLVTGDRLILPGRFDSFAGSPHNSIVRLSSNGVVDSGFNPAPFKDNGDPGSVIAVAEQADGKLVVGGYFHTLDGAAAHNVARLHPDGTRDAAFAMGNSACGANGFNVFTITIRPSDQHLLLGGWFPSYDEANRNNVALVKTTGALDEGFVPAGGLTDFDPEIFSIIPQADGKVIIAGLFTSFNGIPLHNIVRLNPDGSRDTGFGITSGTSRSVRAMVAQPDGKIIIAGTFTGIDGVAAGRVARLNPDGTVDPTFNTGTGPDNICYAVALDSAGNVYVGGGFLNVNGVSRPYIAKLTSTGALDTTFNPGTGFNSIVRAIAPPNGGFGPVVGGAFTSYNGSAANRIVRLNATTGARDPSFVASFNSQVRAIATQPDGKYVVGGAFTAYTNGPSVARSRVARVMSDGTLDTTYNGPTLNGVVRALALQSNGKIIAAGNFSAGGLNQIARFSATGTTDSFFTTGTGAISSPPDAFIADNSAVDALALQGDGSLLAGGIFNQYNGIPRLGLVRLSDSLGFSASSRKTHGAAGIFDIPLPATGSLGVECRSGGANNTHQIVFDMAGPVTFQGASLMGTGTVASSSGGGTSTITLDLTGVSNGQTIFVTLNNVSDGLNMADLTVPVGILLGDTNGNKSVSATDVGQTKAQSGQPAGPGNFRTDVNLSGSINASDIGIVKSQSGATLP